MPNCFLASYDDDSQTGNFLAAGLSKEARSIGHTAIVRRPLIHFPFYTFDCLCDADTMDEAAMDGGEGNEMI